MAKVHLLHWEKMYLFDDYWKGYFNKVDARTAGIGEPNYHNLATYKAYLKSQSDKLNKLK